mmetsp:Transcript_4869/g.12487  ORF Transcript_4869/g.12487 Transcript_4869/m.12487 type:complete len:388 (-) Transcript_4869:1385-2548(-)
MAIPSNVAVPRPSSSRMTSESTVAPASTADVSSNSTRNVECPARILSFAPTRVKMASAGVNSAEAAGTWQPSCAITASRAVCRSNVDLPPMLGPVTMAATGSSPPPSAEPHDPSCTPPSAMSLGTKLVPRCARRWKPPSTRNSGLLPVASPRLSSLGRVRPGMADEAKASDCRQSNSPTQRTARLQRACLAAKRLKSSRCSAVNAASTAAFASSICATTARISLVQYRFTNMVELMICHLELTGLPLSKTSAISSWCVSLAPPWKVTCDALRPREVATRSLSSSAACRSSRSPSTAASYASLTPSPGTTRPDSRAASQSNSRLSSSSASRTPSGKPAPGEQQCASNGPLSSPAATLGARCVRTVRSSFSRPSSVLSSSRTRLAPTSA